MLLKFGPKACVAGEFSLLIACRQACDTSIACEWHMTIGAATCSSISRLSCSDAKLHMCFFQVDPARQHNTRFKLTRMSKTPFWGEE